MNATVHSKPRCLQHTLIAWLLLRIKRTQFYVGIATANYCLLGECASHAGWRAEAPSHPQSTLRVRATGGICPTRRIKGHPDDMYLCKCHRHRNRKELYYCSTFIRNHTIVVPNCPTDAELPIAEMTTHMLLQAWAASAEPEVEMHHRFGGSWSSCAATLTSSSERRESWLQHLNGGLTSKALDTRGKLQRATTHTMSTQLSNSIQLRNTTLFLSTLSGKINEWQLATKLQHSCTVTTLHLRLGSCCPALSPLQLLQR